MEQTEPPLIGQPPMPPPAETVPTLPGIGSTELPAAAEVFRPSSALESAIASGLETLRKEVLELRALLDNKILPGLAEVQSQTKATEKQISFLPPQVRSLGTKIEGVAGTLSDARYRGLLQNLLLIFDLVDQPLRETTVPGSRPVGERRNYEVLRTQLRQILDANGLSEISTDGAFDPEWHRAMETVPCDDPSRAGHVCRMLRPGFRSAGSALRYAEVSVWDFVPPPTPAKSTGEVDVAAALGDSVGDGSGRPLDLALEKLADPASNPNLEQAGTES